MMEIQLMSADASQMQRYRPVVSAAGFKAVTPLAPGTADVTDTATIKNAYIPLPEVKVPKAEEIKEMILNNGYPYKSDIYKAVTRMTEQNRN